jgi:very-short-patch-repair endonuclease
VDGKHWHNYPNGSEIDKIRNLELIEKGYKVLRFWENEFTEKEIKEALQC